MILIRWPISYRMAIFYTSLSVTMLAFFVGIALELWINLVKGGSSFLGLLFFMDIACVVVTLGLTISSWGFATNFRRRFLLLPLQLLFTGPWKAATRLYFILMYGLPRNKIYSTIGSSGSQIRLLVIAPGRPSEQIVAMLRFAELGSNTPGYTALSYTWGLTLFPRCISLNGSPICVTSNLFHALKYLRSETAERLIWCDALCINQSDLNERRQQIGHIRAIYSQATYVTVWLGKGTSTTNLAMCFVGLAQSSANPRLWFDERLRSSFLTEKQEWKAVLCLFSNDYWRRVWIVQETAVARLLNVAYGQYEVPWDLMVEAQRAWMNFRAAAATKEIQLGIELVESIPMLEDALDVRSKPGLGNIGPAPLEINRVSISSGKQIKLLQLLKDSWSALATDPKDKVYALLGLAADFEGSLAADYTLNRLQVYLRVADNILKTHRNLDFITLSGIHTLNGPKMLLYRAPSWIPTFYWAWEAPTTATSNDYIFKDVPYPFAAAGLMPAAASLVSDSGLVNKLLGNNGFILRAKGCRIDRIRRSLLDSLRTREVCSPELGEIRKKETSVTTDWLQKPATAGSSNRERDYCNQIRSLYHYFVSPYQQDEREQQRRTDILWRTLIFNRTSDGDVAPDSWLELFLVIVNGPSALPERFSDQIIPDSLAPPPAVYPMQRSTQERMAREFVQPYLRTFRNLGVAWRRVLETENGMLVVANREVRTGDHVVVVLGCNMPMIMRKTKERGPSGENPQCVLRGPAYIHPYMYGKVTEEIDRGEKNVEEFDFL